MGSEYHVRHRPTTSTAWARAAFAAIVLLVSLAAPVVAVEPWEDYTAAYRRGDYATALRLIRPLADQGDSRAQLLLGVMYSQGEGVPQDFVRAHMWFNLSAAQGENGAARFRDMMTTLMTPELVAEAQKLAREWQPKRHW